MQRKVGSGVTYSDDLLKSGKHLFGSKFDGVFSADQIPSKFRSIIANLDDSDEPGSHWVAIARAPCGRYLVYDSFGRDSDKILKGKLRALKKVQDTENDAEQDKEEDNCGARCLAWLDVFHGHGALAAYQI